MNSATVSGVEERLARLEGKLEDLAGAILRLERQVSSLSGAAGPAAPAPEEAPPETAGAEPVSLAAQLPAQGAVLNTLTRLGTSCLVLGGAFLVRALTDSGILARPLGVGLGLAYAVLWILLAQRAAARGGSTSASFLAITAVIIAYPLIVETSTRPGLAVFAPSGAAASLAALTIFCLVVAWRRGLELFAWSALVAAVAASFVLALVKAEVEPFAAALLAIGLATLWLAYSPKPWRGLRWPAAAAADLFVLWAALKLAPSGPSAPESRPSLSLFLLLAFALPFLYLGSFAVRTLARRRSVVLFDVVQGIAALTVGYGSAALVVRYIKDAQPTLGASAVLIAAGCYGVAFVFVGRRQEQRSNFLFYATLALLLTLAGSALWVRGTVLGLFWCVLAAAAAALGAYFERGTLAVHGAAYTLAAALQTAFFAASLDALFSSVARAWAPFRAPSLAVLATSLLAYVLLAREKEDVRRMTWQIPRIVLAAIAALGAGGLAMAELKASIGGDPGAVAALRTGVLASAALLLAAGRRRTGLAELAWLAYAVLVLGAGKLLLEDLPEGRPATLFVAFVLYGGALLAVPRLLRRAPPPPPREPGPTAA
jgi:hypothetical protein